MSMDFVQLSHLAFDDAAEHDPEHNPLNIPYCPREKITVYTLNMQPLRLASRSLRGSATRSIPFTSRFSTIHSHSAEHKDRIHSNIEAYRETQIGQPKNPHMTNTTSTISNKMPAVGADKAPPEFISAVDPKFTPKDSVPENVERMTGGTQKGAPKKGLNADLGVGEMEGAKFKVEPLRREGEDAATIRARLLCPCHASQHHHHSPKYPFHLHRVEKS